MNHQEILNVQNRRAGPDLSFEPYIFPQQSYLQDGRFTLRPFLQNLSSKPAHYIILYLAFDENLRPPSSSYMSGAGKVELELDGEKRQAHRYKIYYQPPQMPMFGPDKFQVIPGDISLQANTALIVQEANSYIAYEIHSPDMTVNQGKICIPLKDPRLFTLL